jgi:hypothetical protein
MEPPDPYDLSEYNQDLVKANQVGTMKKQGNLYRDIYLNNKEEADVKPTPTPIITTTKIPITTITEITPTKKIPMKPTPINNGAALGRSKDYIKSAWEDLIKDGYKNYLVFKDDSDDYLKTYFKERFKERKNIKNELVKLNRLLNQPDLHTVDLTTKDHPEDQKIWYIPDKQFETLVKEINKNNPGSLQEDIIKRHRQERSDFKHGDGSKKSSISNVYKTYKPWGGKTRKTKGRKCRKTRRIKCKKMKRRKTRK